MLLSIVEVKPLANYTLYLRFDNGECCLFDMRPHLNKGVFKELKDSVLFNTVKVNFDTIEWANEADFDPEYLYTHSQSI